MSEIRPSCIEDLPDELYIKIFSFVSARDLYRSWSSLNCHRINAIISLLSISIHIKNEADFYDYLDGPVEYLASQIVYWKDDRVQPKIILNLRRLLNLRSIHLAESTEGVTNGINPFNHPHLVRLSLPYRFMSSAHIEPMMFGNAQQRFPNLQSIANVWCDSMMLSGNGPTNTTLRHIHLPWATCDVIVYLVDRFPGLVSIAVTEFSTGSLFSGKTFNVGNNVRRLSISSFAIGYSLDELTDLFLYTIPKLTHLQVEFFDCDVENLASLLQSLQFLKKAQFKVKFYPEDFDLASIRTLSAFFTSLDYEDEKDETNKPALVTM